LTWKIAPALATGNTVVAKPSELTPTTADMLCDIAAEAGLPEGVLNVVHGEGKACGGAIVSHPEVPTISFTGSTAVGSWIGGEAGKQFKRVSLELGGKNPFIVFDDADLDDALATAVRAGFSNQGQICLCGSRMLVQRAIFDRFVSGLVEKAGKLAVGDPLDGSTTFGSLIGEAHLAKVAGLVDRARELRGRVHCGGGRIPRDKLPARCASGAFYAPTIITGLDPSCEIEQEEIFGPVVTLQPFDTEEEAVALANGTKYGLAASVFTRDVSRAHRVAARIDAGLVWVNCWMIRDLRTPFGGVKHSGLGREGGWDAMKFFTEPTNVCVKI
jgi:aminomuconate-semialdehyde/2-hydroxymuconate-6-semialdehyde dehydrogenase